MDPNSCQRSEKRVLGKKRDKVSVKNFRIYDNHHHHHTQTHKDIQTICEENDKTPFPVLISEMCAQGKASEPASVLAEAKNEPS